MKSSSQWRWSGVVLLVVLVAVCFFPVLGFEFVYWDDGITVTQNSMMQEPWSWSLAARFFDAETAMRFKPVHWVLMRGLHDIHGMDPVVWHAAGLVLHALVAALLFLVLSKMLRLCFPDVHKTANECLAWIGAALWAVHPLRVEPVAWVTGSTYPLTAVFLLGSFWAYLTAHSVAKRSIGWLACAWACAVMAYGTYPVGVTYGLWLVIVDIAFLRNAPVRPFRWTEPEVRRWWVKHALFIVPALCAVGVTVWTRLTTPGIFNAAPSLDVATWHERLLTAVASLAIFPLKLICPVYLNPNHVEFRESVWSGVLMPSLALVAMLVAAVAFRLRNTRPRFLWLCAGFVVLSLPCLGLTECPVWPVDRYSYIVDMLLISALVGSVGMLIRRRVEYSGLVKIALIGVVGWMLVLGIATVRLLPVWRNTDTLFTHMESAPDFLDYPEQAAHIYELWGCYYAAANRPAEATIKLTRAREVYVAAMRKEIGEGNYSGAVNLAFTMDANLGISPVVRRERGAWLLKLARLQEARRDLQAALAEMPRDVRTRELLGGLDALRNDQDNLR